MIDKLRGAIVAQYPALLAPHLERLRGGHALSADGWAELDAAMYREPMPDLWAMGRIVRNARASGPHKQAATAVVALWQHMVMDAVAVSLAMALADIQDGPSRPEAWPHMLHSMDALSTWLSNGYPRPAAETMLRLRDELSGDAAAGPFLDAVGEALDILPDPRPGR